jgi:hypothetical protein
MYSMTLPLALFAGLVYLSTRTNMETHLLRAQHIGPRNESSISSNLFVLENTSELPEIVWLMSFPNSVRMRQRRECSEF